MERFKFLDVELIVDVGMKEDVKNCIEEGGRVWKPSKKGKREKTMSKKVKRAMYGGIVIPTMIA